MSILLPIVAARLTLLPDLSRGRRLFWSTGQYRPHIVMGPQTQRTAIQDGNRLTETYLGVMFVGGPEAMEPVKRHQCSKRNSALRLQVENTAIFAWQPSCR